MCAESIHQVPTTNNHYLQDDDHYDDNDVLLRIVHDTVMIIMQL